jgi:RNA polymerase sigma-70 factor (ECF subfamily)
VSDDFLARQFDEHREHLQSVAYRMLGSSVEAEDAVQESWLRLNRADSTGIENLRGWLTTVTARVCLNMLRARRTKREESLDTHVPDPIIALLEPDEPSQEAELAESVGLALLVVLETLSPAERLSFVLHDMFAVPFDEIAMIVDRTPDAARQLASRARRRAQNASTITEPDRARQRVVVDAFFAAARDGDFGALVAVLHPDVVLRADGGQDRPTASHVIRGAREVASRATMFSRPDAEMRPALVNGTMGVVALVLGRPQAIMSFTVAHDRIIAIDVLADLVRVGRVDLSPVGP